MKEAGLTHWNSPNLDGSNSSGFTSIPAGQRTDVDGTFIGLGVYDIWWSSTEYNELKPYYRSNTTNNATIYTGSGTLKTRGFPIRCVKN